MQNPLVHFEIHAEDPERAIKFYQTVFGWDIKKWDMPGVDYWVIMTSPQGTPSAINGGLVRRHGKNPSPGSQVVGYVCTMNVKNVDETEKSVLANGGVVALPKMPIPGMGWLVYFIDTEGNVFGAMHEDKNAK